MNETVTVQKKKQEEKKKKFDLKKAVEETKPLVINYRKALGELVTKTYNVYMDCESEEWELYCEEIGFTRQTVENWHREHNLPSKKFLVNHEFGEPLQNADIEENNINEEIIITEDEQIEILQYKETYGILKNAQRLSYHKFQNKYKEKLVTELQTTIKKLNGLLLRLESNIEV